MRINEILVKHQNTIIKIVLFIIVAVLSFVFIYDNFKQEETAKKQEEEEEKEIVKEVVNTNMTKEDKMDFILFLIENDIFTSVPYNDPSDMPISYIAHKLIDWENNPIINDEEKLFIMENYMIEDWQIERAIPYQEIEDYYFELTGKYPLEKDTDDGMIYIKEYDYYIHTEGHGWWGGIIESLTFGSESGDRLFFYPTELIKNNDDYTLKVKQYQIKTEDEFINDSTLKRTLLDFIDEKINTEEANMTEYANAEYILKYENNKWLFKSYKLNVINPQISE